MMNSILNISATRVGLFRSCQRKWAAQYIKAFDGGEPQVEFNTKSTEFGTLMHEKAELWFNDPHQFTREMTEALSEDVEAFPPYAAFAPGITHWPDPGTPNLVVETQLLLVDLDGEEFTSTADVLMAGPEDEILFLGDHKSTGVMAWIMREKNSDTMRDDEQVIIYGHGALQLYPNAKKIKCRWVYYDRHLKKEPYVVEFTLDREYVAGKYREMMGDVRVMRRLHREGVSPTNLEPSYEHCSAFGGCPFRADCENLKNERCENMNLKDLLAANKKRQNGAGSEEQAINPPESGTVDVANPPEEKRKKAKAPVKKKATAKKKTTKKELGSVTDTAPADVELCTTPVNSAEIYLNLARGIASVLVKFADDLEGV